ncbi:MAG: hypothetical protein E6Q99_09145 [Elusimicrobia bacterium]|nr:MAG: hypothetical protein E6Q99_09145 [Elusimicrobiota bacterium]
MTLFRIVRWAPALASLALLAACLGPMPPRDGRPTVPVVPPVVTPEPPLPPVEAPRAEGPRVGVLWIPGPRVDALTSAEYLAQRSSWRVTAVFPDKFFSEHERGRRAKTLFQALVSSKQVDVVLTLPHRPMMPLLMDTENARLSESTVEARPPRFARPEDVLEQLDLARAAHRRRWRVSPTGLALPWDVVVGPELSLVSRFKLRWAVLPASAAAQVLEDTRLPVVRPARLPVGTAARKAWFRSTLEPLVKSSGTYGPLQVEALEDVAALDALAGPGRVQWVPVGELLTEDPLPACLERVPPTAPDLSPWIGEPEENRAWELLGLARQAIADYENSGNAGMNALDLAKKEIHAAEDGRVFFELGSEGNADRGGDVRREFLATLNQVYRLMERPLPPEVRQGFARGASAGHGETEPDGSFERDGAVLRWRDARSDDRGPGDYFYPTGSHPAGSWDLRAFEVRPNAGAITFYYEFTALTNPGRAPGGFSLPLVDTYIDINRSSGAGAQDLLTGRPGLVEATDAWEYALTIDGWGARLVRSALGEAPKLLATLAVKRAGPGAFAVDVPAGALRGSPEAWSFGVAVMGRGADGRPLPVAVDPAPAAFGGAAPERAAPPYIDLLTPPGVSQRRTLGVYKFGQDVTLPFVRAE